MNTNIDRDRVKNRSRGNIPFFEIDKFPKFQRVISRSRERINQFSSLEYDTSFDERIYAGKRIYAYNSVRCSIEQLAYVIEDSHDVTMTSETRGNIVSKYLFSRSSRIFREEI